MLPTSNHKNMEERRYPTYVSRQPGQVASKRPECDARIVVIVGMRVDLKLWVEPLQLVVQTDQALLTENKELKGDKELIGGLRIGVMSIFDYDKIMSFIISWICLFRLPTDQDG